MAVILTTLLTSTLVNHKKEHFSRHNSLNGFQIFLIIVLWITGISTMISSAIVAYKCNHRENMFVKIIIILFALLLCEFYVPYYLIKYVILNRKCGDNVLIRNMTAPKNNKRNRNRN